MEAARLVRSRICSPTNELRARSVVQRCGREHLGDGDGERAAGNGERAGDGERRSVVVCIGEARPEEAAVREVKD